MGSAIDIGTVFFDIGGTLVGRSKEWIPGAREMLSRIRLPGVRLGVISNTGDLNREQLKPLLPPDFNFGMFDSELVILSSEVGIAKPDIRIYLRAVERAAASPCTCVYVGEDLQETFAAQKAGMRAVRVVAASDEIAKLPALLA